ncbi:hypothetical protein BHM03_00057561 [Ensete ventricosum]|nr:hypothetical protein BHM03_00057561 [Ensete ventricosum]
MGNREEEGEGGSRGKTEAMVNEGRCRRREEEKERYLGGRGRSHCCRQRKTPPLPSEEDAAAGGRHHHYVGGRCRRHCCSHAETNQAELAAQKEFYTKALNEAKEAEALAESRANAEARVEVESRLMEAVERETMLVQTLEELRQSLTRTEQQISCIRAEQTQLSRSLEKERQRASESRQEYLVAMEEAATQEGRAKQLEDEIKEIRSKHKKELQDEVIHRELLEKVISTRTARYRAVLPKIDRRRSISGRKREEERGKEEKRRGEERIMCRPRQRAVAARARFFSRTWRQNVSPRGEKDRGDVAPFPFF